MSLLSPRQTLELHRTLQDLSPLRQGPINGSHPINKDLLPAAAHGSSKKNRKHPVWKDATLDGRRKSRSAARAELCMPVLAIVKEFSSGIAPRLGSFILSRASGLVPDKA